MILGIDASNLRDGGGVTHLRQILGAADPQAVGIQRVFVWCGRRLADTLPARTWLSVEHHRLLDGPVTSRLFFQYAVLEDRLRRTGCDALFAPGGMLLRRPAGIRTFTMCRSMLPFEDREFRRYSAIGAPRLRLRALARLQRRSMEQVDGLIFLTEYARAVLASKLRRLPANAVIPHGVDEAFFPDPRDEADVTFSATRPFKLLYVSTIDLYKHQWHVAEAVSRLRNGGMPITLTMIGPTAPAAAGLFKGTLAKLDAEGSYLHYLGKQPHADLPGHYRNADAFVFASSCENLPNVLLEAMASGLAIASSNLGPMPEILGDAGVYFHPERPDQIAACIRLLVGDATLRRDLSARAYRRASQYSWQICAESTVRFIQHLTLADNHSGNVVAGR